LASIVDYNYYNDSIRFVSIERMQCMQKAMPKYYTYNQQKYSICFPLEWAINHFEQTGPSECVDCREYGCDDSVFKQYCYDCQLYEYMGTRVTDEYCDAAIRQPVQYTEIRNSMEMSDISDDEDSLSVRSYNADDVYSGNDECKLSVVSMEDEEESMSRSSVMPILQKYLDNTSTISMELCSGSLHLTPSFA
jgi:hypothetical protein